MEISNTLKLMSEFQRFQKAHPKAVQFAASLARDGVKEGTILELKLTDPDGEEKVCNIRITAEDLSLLELLKELGSKR